MGRCFVSLRHDLRTNERTQLQKERGSPLIRQTYKALTCSRNKINTVFSTGLMSSLITLCTVYVYAVFTSKAVVMNDLVSKYFFTFIFSYLDVKLVDLEEVLERYSTYVRMLSTLTAMDMPMYGQRYIRKSCRC